MKQIRLLTAVAGLVLAAHGLGKDPPPVEQSVPAEPIAKHQQGAAKVSADQDELSADVQQLTIEQTIPKVIELFKDVEQIMDEATDWLAEYDTGGRTMAAQTEVIEKIYEASKERQQQQGSGKSGSAMMDMMEKMMQEDEGKNGGKPQPGKKPGETGGGGVNGDSAAASDATWDAGDGKSEARRIPKAAGAAGRALPDEFRKALDAYNRGVEKKVR
jgi:hypothetical protein